MSAEPAWSAGAAAPVFAALGDAQDLAFDSRNVISAVLVDGPARSTPDGTIALAAEDGQQQRAQIGVPGLFWLGAAFAVLAALLGVVLAGK